MQHDPFFPIHNRRRFLKTSGHLLLGFSIVQFPLDIPAAIPAENSSLRNGLGDSAAVNPINSWIRIDSRGYVTVLTGKMELGQGVKTALMQIAAEELDIDMNRVRIITADTGQTPNERYTAGSASIESSGKSIRNAAAEARAKLLDLASEKLRVEVSNLSIKNGVVRNKESNEAVSYGELLQGKQIEGEVSGKAPLKDPSTYKLVGASIPREDIVLMATGMPFYVHDIRLDGMVHGRIVRLPVYEARLIPTSIMQAESLPGVLKIIRNGSFIGLIAAQEYQVVKAMHAIQKLAVWEKKPLSPLVDNLFNDMRANAGKGETIVDSPGLQLNLSSSPMKHEAMYKRPYHMHGSIGPSCAIAKWENDFMTIWSHTQGVYPLRQSIANLLSISEDQIRVIGVPGSGCYGHNGADDVAADAALLAKEFPGKPVRVQWMREDEHRWEPYGSAMMINITGGLDAAGKVTAWKTEIWSDTHSTRPGGRAGHLIGARNLEKPFQFSTGGFSGGSTRNSIPLYDFAAKQIVLHNYKGPLRTSALRSLGAYANIFALESFIDELAIKAGKDPVDFRLSHLKDERAKEVINVLAKKVAWKERNVMSNINQKVNEKPQTKNNKPKTTNNKPSSALGFAFAQYKNEAAYFAVVAEVYVDRAQKTFRVTKLTGCIEAGQTINKDGIKNQTSGGMIQSASWTLLEQVQYNAEGIQSSGWDTYPILRFSDVPDTEVIVIDRPQEEPLGAGEAAQGPTAAAIANAIYAATGNRLRELPLTADKIKW